MCRTPVHSKNRGRVQNFLAIVPYVGTFRAMLKSPLREYLDQADTTAEAFAAAKGMSAWSVRHWARGDKLPNRGSQLDIERATDGKVSPADWLSWDLERANAPVTTTQPAADAA